MIIREAIPSDLDEIVSIEKRVFKSPWTRDQIRWELESQPVAKHVVALIRGKIIGYIFTHKFEEEAQILNVAVDIPFQHKGIGYDLVDYVLQTDLSALDVYLEVKRTNFPAINLYLKHHFEDVGIREGYYEDGEDALLMVKRAKNHGVV